jgi:hypothetical protein
MGVAQSRTAAGREPRPDRRGQAGSRALTGEDRLIDGDDQVDRPRFGRPPGDPGTLVSGQHRCAPDQDQDERGQITLADATEPARRALEPAGFRARAVVIES